MIIKELVKEFKGQFNCIWENTDKYVKYVKTISCRLQFIDSARFMANSLSNLVNNLA